MKGFFSFVRKETLHILRDRRTMLIVLLMPVVQVLLFGFAISVEVNNIDFAVVASHPTEAVRRQVERIAANPYFTFGGYIRQDEADEVLRTGEVGAVVVFADDYDRRTAGSGEPDGAAIQLIFDASNPNDASSGAGYLRSVLLAEGTGGAPTPELHLLYNPQMKSSYNFVPGLMGLIFMLICAMMTSVSIVREKETGTMEVLLVSPVRPLRIVVAKMIPYFLLSCVNLATILLLARFVLGVPMSGSVVGLVGLSLLYLVLALALGLFISTMADSQVTAMLISGMLLILPLIMRTAEEALMAVPDSYREGSFGLGAGRLRTVFRIVLPAAGPGILSGVILGIGRIVGETAALIFTAGTMAQIPGLFQSGRTLAIHMYVLSGEALHMNEANATAVVLLLVVLLMNMLSALAAKKLTKK